MKLSGNILSPVMPVLTISQRLPEKTCRALRETLENWEDDAFDFDSCKRLLMDFVHMHCKTEECSIFSTDPKDFKMKPFGESGLILRYDMITCKMCYVFHKETGMVVVAAEPRDIEVKWIPQMLEWKFALVHAFSGFAPPTSSSI